jgi:pyruvate dehydrogenase (quinone)
MHALRVEQSSELEEAMRSAFAHHGPVLLDVVTNPDEVSLPPKVKPAQAWGFAIAKLTETLESRSG